MDRFLKFYLCCRLQPHCRQCCCAFANLLLPALATVMSTTRKKPTIHTTATGSTTVISMPETNAAQMKCNGI